MKKFQFFLIVEAILLTMALVTVLSDDLFSFVLLLVMVLLALRFQKLGSKTNFVLTTGLLILFLIFMLNPYVILAIICGIAYVMINHFSQVKKKNRYALIQLKEEGLKVAPTANQWIGNSDHDQVDSYAFDDINIIRMIGSDVIDLSQVILSGRDNLILIRKVYGPTKILVPVDVSVKLDVNSVYGSVTFFDFPEYDLRNEAIKLAGEDNLLAVKSVKIIVSVLAGSVEVIRV